VSSKFIFLDMDGTLVEDLATPSQPRRVCLRSGAGAALRLLARLDYRFILVSKHDEVARDRLLDLLFRERVHIEDYYRADCIPAMLAAPDQHHVDLKASWLLGPILNGLEAGNRAGCRTMLIDTGDETEWRLGSYRVPTHIVPDLYGAAMLIARAD
jgi:D-glycero-D-manno-heptose 1,7-bisphosphate phosphatase